MKIRFTLAAFAVSGIMSFHLSAQSGMAARSIQTPGTRNLFIDVHQLEPGKVTFKAVAEAHSKDLATQAKYDVEFLKYWVDEKKGLVYCLSSSADTESIRKTHAEAHGLLPNRIYPVTAGTQASVNGNNNLFLDVHYFGTGNVSANDVA